MFWANHDYIYIYTKFMQIPIRCSLAATFVVAIPPISIWLCYWGEAVRRSYETRRYFDHGHWSVRRPRIGRSPHGNTMENRRDIPNNLAVCQNLVPLVNIKIAGKWMFIPLKMVCIGIDPYPSDITMISLCLNMAIKVCLCPSVEAISQQTHMCHGARLSPYN